MENACDWTTKTRQIPVCTSALKQQRTTVGQKNNVIHVERAACVGAMATRAYSVSPIYIRPWACAGKDCSLVFWWRKICFGPPRRTSHRSRPDLGPSSTTGQCLKYELAHFVYLDDGVSASEDGTTVQYSQPLFQCHWCFGNSTLCISGPWGLLIELQVPHLSYFSSYSLWVTRRVIPR